MNNPAHAHYKLSQIARANGWIYHIDRRGRHYIYPRENGNIAIDEDLNLYSGLANIATFKNFTQANDFIQICAIKPKVTD